MSSRPSSRGRLPAADSVPLRHFGKDPAHAHPAVLITRTSEPDLESCLGRAAALPQIRPRASSDHPPRSPPFYRLCVSRAQPSPECVVISNNWRLTRLLTPWLASI